MARDFIRADSEYLINESAVLTSTPLTMACFFNPDAITDDYGLIGIGDASATDTWFLLAARGSVAGEPISAFTRQTGGNAIADTTTGFSAGTWQHAAAVFTSASDRAAFLNGGGKGTNTSTETPTLLDRTTIGCIPRSALDQNMDGLIAEAGIWNVALTDGEIALLAAGVSPLLVRSQNLVTYVPLVRDNDEDLIGGLTFTPGATPTVAPHPRIIYPPAQILPFPTVVVGGATTLHQTTNYQGMNRMNGAMR